MAAVKHGTHHETTNQHYKHTTLVDIPNALCKSSHSGHSFRQQCSGCAPPPHLPPPTVLPSDCRFSKYCAAAKWFSQFLFFHMTLRVIVMHHPSKFGYKRLSTSEDIFWTKPNTWTDRHDDASILLQTLSCCYTNSPCVIPPAALTVFPHHSPPSPWSAFCDPQPGTSSPTSSPLPEAPSCYPALKLEQVLNTLGVSISYVIFSISLSLCLPLSLSLSLSLSFTLSPKHTHTNSHTYMYPISLTRSLSLFLIKRPGYR